MILLNPIILPIIILLIFIMIITTGIIGIKKLFKSLNKKD